MCLGTDEFVALLPKIYIPPSSITAFKLRKRCLVAVAIGAIYESEHFSMNIWNNGYKFLGGNIDT